MKRIAATSTALATVAVATAVIVAIPVSSITSVCAVRPGEGEAILVEHGVLDVGHVAHIELGALVVVVSHNWYSSTEHSNVGEILSGIGAPV